MNKSELRKVFLAKRRSLSTEAILEKSRKIADRFFAEFDLEGVKTLHCFVSIQRLAEIDTSLIYKRVWDGFSRIRIVAPRIDPALGEIESVAFASESELVENRWGIREPAANAIIDPAEIDAVLIPVLCYDQRGNRIGYGKGFYDRFLGKCRPDCRKIGISFFEPVDKIDDIAEHDVPLDDCVTPDRSYAFSQIR